MNLRASYGIVLGFAALAAASAQADTLHNLELELSSYGEFRHTQLSAFPIDNIDTSNPQTINGQSRIGAEIGLNYKALTLETALDVYVLRAYGPSNTVGTQLGSDTFREPRDAASMHAELFLRSLSLSYRSGFGTFRCGQQTSHWGLGMMVNHGRPSVRFGHAFNGNTTMRCMFATKPLRSQPNLLTLIAGDAVYRDDNAEWKLGDRAYAGVVGVHYTTDKKSFGLLTSLRTQTDRLDTLHPAQKKTTLDVLILDGYWENTLSLWNQTLRWSGEGAFIVGKTNRPYLEETYESGATVQALGGVTRLESDLEWARLAFELGYASGDNDPTDSVMRTFNFNSSYGVGLILIDHVMPLLTARSVDRIDDQSLLDVTPPGLRFTVNQGQLSANSYLNPSIHFGASRGLYLDLAYFYFVSTASLNDLYQSNLYGGYTINHGGYSDPGRHLGQEINARLGYRYFWAHKPIDTQSLDLNIEGGTFLPGSALKGLDDQSIYCLQINARVFL